MRFGRATKARLDFKEVRLLCRVLPFSERYSYVITLLVYLPWVHVQRPFYELSPKHVLHNIYIPNKNRSSSDLIYYIRIKKYMVVCNWLFVLIPFGHCCSAGKYYCWYTSAVVLVWVIIIYSSWASSFILYSSSFVNMCRWAIAYSLRFENMYVQMSYRLDIAQASKTCADELRPIAQAGENMCSSCSFYSSSWPNMCRWAIVYSSSFETCADELSSCSSSRENMCSSRSSRGSPVSYPRKELARAALSWSVRHFNTLLHV